MRIVVLLFIALFLYAADINTTIINGDAKIYESILADIKKSKSLSDEKTLQETLLYKLINITKAPNPKPLIPKQPKNEQEYRQLLAQFLDWIEKKANFNQNLQSLQDKIEAMQEQIQDIQENNDTTLFTLQLQDAFYTKAKILLQKKLFLYDDAIKKTPSLFVEALQRIDLDSNKSRIATNRLQKALQNNQKEIQKLEVEKERLQLLGRNDRVQRLQRSIKRLQQKRKDLIKQKLIELFIQLSTALQSKRSKEVFSIHHTIIDTARTIYPQEVVDTISKVLSSIEKSLLGRAAVIKGATIEQIKITLQKVWQEANTPLFTINKTPISAFKLFIALLVLFMGFLIGVLYKKGIKSLAEHSRTITPSTGTLLANLGYYFIVVIAFFIILKVLGIDLSSIALIAGALSVGIGFGLQNMVSNFVSGLILMFERSVKIGDYVEIDDNLTGRISDIRMRSTTITTNDNIDVIVPNQDLIQNRVVNWTMNDKIRRFRIPFGVAYGTDAKKVIEIVKEAVAKSGYGDIYQDARRKTRVIMTDMGDSSVNFELFVWIRGNEILYPKRTISRFLILIYEALNKNGIEIPFPQRDLHIRSIDTPIPITIKKEEQCNNS